MVHLWLKYPKFGFQRTSDIVSRRIREGHLDLNEGKKLMQTTWNSLKLADAKNLTSIVFPPISKEMRGFTTEFCAKAMLLSIKKYLKENNNNLRNVSICLETQQDFEIFENLLADLAT